MNIAECTKQDFYSQPAIDAYEKLVSQFGYNPLCFKKASDIELSQVQYHLKSKSIEIHLERCSSNCASGTLDPFLNNLKVLYGSLEAKVNLNSSNRHQLDFFWSFKGSTVLTTDRQQVIDSSLTRNEFVMHSNMLNPLEENGFVYYQWNTWSHTSQQRPVESAERSLLLIRVFLDSMKKEIHREVYGFFELCADVGGVLEFLIVIFAIFVRPVSEFLFQLKALELLYMLRTKCEKIVSADHALQDLRNKDFRTEVPSMIKGTDAEIEA